MAAAVSRRQVNTLSQISTQQVQLSVCPSASPSRRTRRMAIRFTNIDQILHGGPAAEDVPTAIHQIAVVLRDRHRLRHDEPDDFDVRNLTEFAKALDGHINAA